jgi:hypothetical protein
MCGYKICYFCRALEQLSSCVSESGTERNVKICQKWQDMTAAESDARCSPAPAMRLGPI